MRCITEEDYKLNIQVTDKLVIQMSLLTVILASTLIFSVISLLREDSLSTGILDMFFL
jgi:hypothetical protein